jgi:chemotaxis methyl-accepting protein methylase
MKSDPVFHASFFRDRTRFEALRQTVGRLLGN